MGMSRAASMNVYDAGAIANTGITRRDIVDFIIQLTPAITPKLSAFGKTDAKQIRHEWFDDTLPAAAYTKRADGIAWPAASQTCDKVDVSAKNLSDCNCNLLQRITSQPRLQISKFRPCEINSGAVADTNTKSQLRLML